MADIQTPYRVLARKYRPGSFDELIGQDALVRTLKNAIESNRIAHAFMLTGVRGVGKTTTARIIAKALNYTGPDGKAGPTTQPTDDCAQCQSITEGRHPDVMEMDAASRTGVDDIREILDGVRYAPTAARYKIYIIDEVHMLSKGAFNALLKTLEEPPPHVVFVLATTDPQKVPVTVLSRCLQFNLRPMAPEVVMEHLAHVLAAEDVAAEQQALRLLARAARGSMRDALSLTDQAIAFGSGRLQEAAVRQMLGSVDRSVVFSLIGALAAGDGKAVVELCEQLRAAGLSAATTLEDMASVLQRMAVHQAVPDMAVDDTDPEAQETARLAAVLPADETQLLYSLCIHGRAELGLAPDEYAGLTMVLLRLLPFKQGGTGKAAAATEKKTLKPAEAPPLEAGSALPPALVASAALADTEPARVGAALGRGALSTGGASTRSRTADEAAAVSPVTVDEDMDGPGFAPPEAALSGDELPAQWDVEERQATAPARAPARPPVQALPVREPWRDELRGQGEAAATAPGQAREIRPAADVMAIKVEGDTLEELPALRAIAAPEPVPVPVAGGADSDFWHALVQDLVAREAVTALVRELALQSQLMARQPDEWTLRVESESLGQSGARERLQAALADAGHAVRLSVQIGRVSDSPARRNAIAASQRMKAAEALLMADPFVQEMMRDFGARIVPGSIKPL